MKVNKYLIIAGIVIIAILYFLFRIISNKNDKLEQINNLYKVAQDSMITYRNALGQQVAKSSVLETEKQSYFLILESNDQQIKQLQDLLKAETKKNHDVEVAVVFKTKP